MYKYIILLIVFFHFFTSAHTQERKSIFRQDTMELVRKVWYEGIVNQNMELADDSADYMISIFLKDSVIYSRVVSESDKKDTTFYYKQNSYYSGVFDSYILVPKEYVHQIDKFHPMIKGYADIGNQSGKLRLNGIFDHDQYLSKFVIRENYFACYKLRINNVNYISYAYNFKSYVFTDSLYYKYKSGRDNFIDYFMDKDAKDYVIYSISGYVFKDQTNIPIIIAYSVLYKSKKLSKYNYVIKHVTYVPKGLEEINNCSLYINETRFLE